MRSSDTNYEPPVDGTRESNKMANYLTASACGDSEESRAYNSEYVLETIHGLFSASTVSGACTVLASRRIFDSRYYAFNTMLNQQPTTTRPGGRRSSHDAHRILTERSMRSMRR